MTASATPPRGIGKTYARIRWAIPPVPRRTVVLGGFIGATEDGRATTLGRGGSDLTAALIGAALNAEEIQFWKDVDGLLTWNPKIKAGGYRVRQLSYAEMSELAEAGASILHPDSIAPAGRLRIPVTLRNTFRPQCEGTKIGLATGQHAAVVKSIACRTNITLLELRSPDASEDLGEYSARLEQVAKRQNAAVNVLAVSGNVMCLALDSQGSARELDFHPDTCVEARVRSQCAIVTLVGEGIATKKFRRKLCAILAPVEGVVLPVDEATCSIHAEVRSEFLPACLEALQRAFFTDVDPAQFAFTDPVETPLETLEAVESLGSKSFVFARGANFRSNPKLVPLRGVM